MNSKLVLKTVFFIAVLLLLVIMGMYNQQSVGLSLPPILPRVHKLPAALMYFAFFAVGFLSGTLLTAGHKGGSKSAK
jgi:uncharacterized integral membrane protein